ncbi:MAG: hypothetical protein GX216_08075 [Methanomicrobiales archaeon]|nr:hypothetical protein [Methanomicrobiales archaeon]
MPARWCLVGAWQTLLSPTGTTVREASGVAGLPLAVRGGWCVSTPGFESAEFEMV